MLFQTPHNCVTAPFMGRGPVELRGAQAYPSLFALQPTLRWSARSPWSQQILPLPRPITLSSSRHQDAQCVAQGPPAQVVPTLSTYSLSNPKNLFSDLILLKMCFQIWRSFDKMVLECNPEVANWEWMWPAQSYEEIFNSWNIFKLGVSRQNIWIQSCCWNSRSSNFGSLGQSWEACFRQSMCALFFMLATQIAPLHLCYLPVGS